MVDKPGLPLAKPTQISTHQSIDQPRKDRHEPLVLLVHVGQPQVVLKSCSPVAVQSCLLGGLGNPVDQTGFLKVPFVRLVDDPPGGLPRLLDQQTHEQGLGFVDASLEPCLRDPRVRWVALEHFGNDASPLVV